jgi:hypothetical protein
VSLGKEQYGTSLAELERFRTESWDELTSILVRFDDQENQRRIVEENNRLEPWRKDGKIIGKSWENTLQMEELSIQLVFSW